MEGEHEHEHEPTQVITPVVETESKLTAPLIDHEGKITRIEERQAQHQEEMIRQLGELESRLVTATSGQIAGIEEKIARLESKLAESTPVPDESVELTLPDVETSPAPPEKIRQGLRHRRKERRKGKN